MKKLVSVGLLASGTTGAQAVDVPGETASMPKPWSVSATLRGFYDDNFNTVPNNSTTTRQSALALKSALPSPAMGLPKPSLSRLSLFL